jgi:hypothetical protein
MKQILYIICITLALNCNAQQSTSSYIRSSNPDTTDATNDFYDNEKTFEIPQKSIRIEGEIEKALDLDFSSLPVRSVIVKETFLTEDGNKFHGAYRYDGYSLYDILNHVKIQKKNEEEFAPIIDLYVQIENDKGEKVNVSWGEIYYPTNLHEIIIATRVMRIVPTKSKDQWPLPTTSKLVFANDLLTERNISSPTKITVKSYNQSFVTIKGLDPCYSPSIKIFNNDVLVDSIFSYPQGISTNDFHTIFYGRGRGIHSTMPFNGIFLKELISKYVEINRQNLREGLILAVGKDGFRGVYSFSEVMNRNDQSEVLLVYRPDDKRKGVFRLFPACDFFSDRAVKGLMEIYIAPKGK